ncbi:hypothetical protein MD535_18205 [Vibrio sp. ZSDZ65]|uniref:Uncharacterized protein n=1 Tax=Vibrio qingdaonensis TaxID=2829491 RepID=A0A9X3CQW3_9VIBR|nr:hypothetical protein [Vibrio qingdaonensis]MCW8347923.1 hypothetical protein [Vibrio qingdaonensis]
MNVNDSEGLLTLMEREILNVQVDQPDVPSFNLGSLEKISGHLDLARLKIAIKELTFQEEVFSFGYISSHGNLLRIKSETCQCDIR